MSSGIGRYLTILVSTPILLGCVAMILSTIVLLKKGKQYNKWTRRLLIALLMITSVIAVYLVYLAFEFSNPHPPVSPVPIY